jgi:hypothetical protein
MSFPSPRTGAERRRDRQAFHEMGQLVRALEDTGPSTRDELGERVGARYWEDGRFDRALDFAVSDGLVSRSLDGRLEAGLSRRAAQPKIR